MGASARFVVVGGGVVAASVAYHLARRGASVIIATGHGAEGLTVGPWSGLAVALLALGQPPATDLTPFDPSRPQV